LNVNPRAAISVDSVAGLPILMIDDFYADPWDVREQALRVDYSVSPARYPGLNSPISMRQVAPALGVITAVVAKMADFSLRPEDIESDFSILTMAPDDYLPAQRHPHIDPWPLLGLVYLTPGSTVGTSFYYSDTLGYAAASTDHERHAHERLIQRLSADPDQGEINSQRWWKRMHSIQPIFNRFVLFPGNLLHAADMRPEEFSRDAERVRLTQRFIVKRVIPKSS
jgi:hypothetical protein